METYLSQRESELHSGIAIGSQSLLNYPKLSREILALPAGDEADRGPGVQGAGWVTVGGNSRGQIDCCCAD